DTGGEVERAARAVGGDQGRDHIAHVYVVARGLAVTEHLGRLARVEVLGEDRHHTRLAVGALARTVNVAQATHRVGHTGGQRPRIEVRLGRPLRRAVGSQGRGDALLVRGQ